MTKVIACAHEKGGVGKTTTTVSLGIWLAREGKKVLLLDADPQGDMIKCLGIEKPKELTCTLSTAMDYIIDHGDDDGYPDFEYFSPIRQHPEGVDFIPANGSLAATEVSLVNSMSRETVMRQYIPICPNLMFTRFLRESIPQQRDARRHMAQQILRRCRVLVVCGEAVTEEMEAEIMLAKRLGIVSTTLMGLQAISDFTQEDGQEE